MPQFDWSLYQLAYTELSRRGVAHDAAADKAFYLMSRGDPATHHNWLFLAAQCRAGEWRQYYRRRSHSLSEPCFAAAGDDGPTLGDQLADLPGRSNPEQLLLLQEELRGIPLDILTLFTERDRRMTSAETVRLHRFRKGRPRR